MLNRRISIWVVFTCSFLFQQAATCQSKSDAIKQGERLYYEGKDLYYDGEYRSARLKYDEVLKIYTENLDAPHELLYKIYHRSLRNETKLRNFARAKELGQKAMYNASEVFGEVSDETAIIYTAMGLLSYKERRVLDAISYNDKALRVSTEMYGLESRESGNVIMNNANNYAEKGDLNKAIEMGEFALNIFQKTLRKDHQNFNRVYLNLSSMYRDKRDLQKALEYGEKALEIKLKNYKESHPSVSKYYNNLAKILASLKQFEASELYFKKSIEISKNSYGYDSAEVGHGINDMARIFMNEDNLEKALEAYTKANEILSRTNESEDRKYVSKINQAVVEYDLGRKEQAIEKMHLIADVLKLNEGDHYANLTDYYTLLSSLYRNNDELGKAETALESAVEYLSKIDGNDETSFLKMAYEGQKSKWLLAKGGTENLLMAQESINQSISDLINLRKSYLGSASKSSINDYLGDNFELGIDVGRRLYELDASYENLNYLYSTIERAKAASFWDSDSEQDAYNFGGASAAIIADIEFLKSNISASEQDLEASITAGEIQVVKDSLFRDKRRLESLFEKIENEYPKYYELKYKLKNHSILNLQTKIPVDLAVLDYFLLDDEALCIYISKNEAKLFSSKLVPQIADLLVNKIRQFTIEENNGIYNAFFAQVNEQLRKEELTRVAIVPHDFLHFLSFDQLKSPSSGAFLIRNYAFSSQLRTEDIFSDMEVQASNSYLGFAPKWRATSREGASSDFSRELLFALPGAVTEIEQSSDLLKGEILLNEDAKEATFKANASKYNILHFATHAHLDPENDANSCLYLYEFNEQRTVDGEDGKLYANEIADLELKAELVILSACNTGNGKINSGEGVMSLSRAFKFAGAKSILMSLWLSNDQSSVPIITDFVANLKKGLPKDVALQQAKVKFLGSADPFMKDEYYWAGFMVNGELSAIMKKRTNFYLYLLPVLFLVFGLWYRSRMGSKKVA